MTWREHACSSWIRTDGAVAAQTHDDDGNVTSTYWLAWPPILDPDDLPGIMRRRFKTRQAAMACIDREWPAWQE